MFRLTALASGLPPGNINAKLVKIKKPLKCEGLFYFYFIARVLGPQQALDEFHGAVPSWS